MAVTAAPVLALSAAVVIWGTTFVVSDDALATTSPAVLTVARFAVAGVVLGLLARGRPGLRRAVGSPSVALLGLTGVAAYYGLQNAGLVHTTAGTAALLQAVLPVATALLGWIWLEERPLPADAVGLALATAGVVLVAGGEIVELDLGALLVLGGVLAYAIYTVLLRLRRQESDVVVLALATCLWGLVFMLPWQVWELADGQAALEVTLPVVSAIAYLGVVASGGTLVLWTYGAARVPATVAGVLLATIPAVGYAVAVMTGESAESLKVLGCGLALVGAMIVTAAAARRRPAAPSPPPATAPRGAAPAPRRPSA